MKINAEKFLYFIRMTVKKESIFLKNYGIKNDGLCLEKSLMDRFKNFNKNLTNCLKDFNKKELNFT